MTFDKKYHHSSVQYSSMKVRKTLIRNRSQVHLAMPKEYKKRIRKLRNKKVGGGESVIAEGKGGNKDRFLSVYSAW